MNYEDLYRAGTELRVRTVGGLNFGGPVLRMRGDLLFLRDRRTDREVMINILHVEKAEVVR